MTVTLVEEYTKAKSKIYLDGEFAFVLYKGELRHYHIAEGQQLGGQIYREIIETVLVKRARLRSMHLLQSRDYTCKQLSDKLRRDFYPPCVVEDAVAYVSSYRYLDDVRYALNYIRCHQNHKSRRAMDAELVGKGISERDIERAWEGFAAEGNELDELQQIRQLAAKRHFDPRQADARECARMYAYLMRRGFAPGEIRKALKECQYDERYTNI